MSNKEFENIKVIELLCLLTILAELSKDTTPIDDFKELSFKNVLG